MPARAFIGARPGAGFARILAANTCRATTAFVGKRVCGAHCPGLVDARRRFTLEDINAIRFQPAE
jgi:hypothetical protein